MKRFSSIQMYIFALILALAGCENDIEKINMLADESTEFPTIVGENIEVMYSDSGIVKVQMHAPELKQFSDAEKPYSEFPKGMIVYFYDDSLMIESEIRADYAIYHNEEKLWHAEGNVRARNYKTGERLDSEELYWDEENEEVYSNTFTRIENSDGTFYGQNGFRSNQTLTKYTLIGSRGVVNIKDDE